jgi:hypothetical protein
MNNNSSDIDGCNRYDLWVIKWLCSNACRSEFVIGQNICDTNDMKNLPSMISQVTTSRLEQKTEMMTNNTTPHITIIIPTHIQLA